jgi:hypothetical protein
MYEPRTAHPVNETASPLDAETREAMWQLFVQIGRFWGNVPDPEPMRSRLHVFLDNRIEVNPLYREFYRMAREVIRGLVEVHGEQKGYEVLFTDPVGLATPPTTALQYTRQFVSNELIALQLSLGGFLAWGATNYPGYFGGANVPGMPAPYRAIEEKS